MKKFMTILSILVFAAGVAYAGNSNFVPANVSDGTSAREPRVPKKSLFGLGESEFWKKEAKRSGLSEFGANTKNGLKKLWLPNSKGFFAKQREAYLERNKK